MTGFGMMKFIYIGTYSVVVKSIAWQSEGLGFNLANLRICQNKKISYLIKLWLRALRFNIFLVKTCVLSNNCCGAMRY